jgi:phospho-N-acetylmuramoyl-pentapeptide-transferase
MLYHLVYPLHTYWSALNVFRYINFRLVYAAVIAFFVCLLLGPYLIRRLQALHIGQQIRPEGPKSHINKSGTPTMGGVMIVAGILISTILWADPSSHYIWLVVLAVVGFGLIGFMDDYLKVVKKKSEGLRPRQKLFLQVLVAMTISLLLFLVPGFTTHLTMPFLKGFSPDLGWWYLLFSVLVIVGASNAVNLTDGLDGLAIGPVAITFVAFTIVSYVSGHKKFAEYLLIPYIDGAGELAIFCAAVFGASLGFLWFNAYPAYVFMGDVGSLPLGAALGTVAVITKHEILLVLVGGVFVIEALSVIIQVISYKTTGRRVFLMAPIHHHFELKGWEEPKVVVRFLIISIILTLMSLSTLKLR